jgi:hypothetical protein
MDDVICDDYAGPLRCGVWTVPTHLKMEYCNPNPDDLKLLERSGPPRYELVLSRADQSLSTATSNLYSTCKKKKMAAVLVGKYLCPCIISHVLLMLHWQYLPRITFSSCQTAHTRYPSIYRLEGSGTISLTDGISAAQVHTTSIHRYNSLRL